LSRFLLTLLIFSLLTKSVVSQNAVDTAIVKPADTAIISNSKPLTGLLPGSGATGNTISKNPHPEYAFPIETGIYLNTQLLSQVILQKHPFFGFGSKASVFNGESTKKIFKGKEIIFYLLIILLLVFAVLKNVFSKYFADLFRVFFRTTLKQKQISEQLIQTPLPSLLMNGFFVITGGLYLAFIIDYYESNPLQNFWLLSVYCSTGLSLIYLLKFLSIRIAGWLFSMPEAANSYIFIVFVINKVIGLLLLPFLILLAFTVGYLNQVSIILSFCLIGIMLLYRLILTLAIIRNQVKVNLFHFFLYLVAFEMAPFLLIGKLVLEFLSIST